MHVNELISILQASVGPVILISGVGLLILSMTNRLARVLDRSRQVAEARRKAQQQERKRFEPQLKILVRRAHLLRSAIRFAVLSVLVVAILVIALFLTAFLHVEVILLSAILFIVCLVSLIASLLVFLQDINLSLAALKLDLDQSEDQPV
jgi:hypothetical protein